MLLPASLMNFPIAQAIFHLAGAELQAVLLYFTFSTACKPPLTKDSEEQFVYIRVIRGLSLISVKSNLPVYTLKLESFFCFPLIAQIVADFYSPKWVNTHSAKIRVIYGIKVYLLQFAILLL